ncbi:hypothetical protein VTJ49DRAFT_6685 [Mycothermus thermophilus]|uniref:Uncharacterized protein n=1 Tax=Humicola insolens TaxID=85995 RepID=A0ABR3VLC7_HUMIN
MDEGAFMFRRRHMADTPSFSATEVIRPSLAESTRLRRKRSRQGCLRQAKSPGIARYRSELVASKPVILLPNWHTTRLHTTVTTTATQPHHNPPPQPLAASLVQIPAAKREGDLVGDLPYSHRPLPPGRPQPAHGSICQSCIPTHHHYHPIPPQPSAQR